MRKDSTAYIEDKWRMCDFQRMGTEKRNVVAEKKKRKVYQ